jgi:Archaeal transcriptional regulator TrmB
LTIIGDKRTTEGESSPIIDGSSNVTNSKVASENSFAVAANVNVVVENSPAIPGYANYAKSKTKPIRVAKLPKSTRPDLNAARPGTVELDFGSDTLSAARLVASIKQEKGLLSGGVAVSVVGVAKDNPDRSFAKTAEIDDVNLDGYVRNILIRDLARRRYTVGGSNATKEDVAASSIMVVLNRDILYDTTQGNLSVYESTTKTDDGLRHLIEHADIPMAHIAYARSLKTPLALRYLGQVLQNNKSSQILEYAAEGFRSFEGVYAKHRTCANEAAKSLLTFIQRSANRQELGTAIVYAAESLGYIARSSHEASPEIAEFLLGMIGNDHVREIHKDIFWSAIVGISHHLLTEAELSNVEAVLPNFRSHADFVTMKNVVTKIRNNHLLRGRHE